MRIVREQAGDVRRVLEALSQVIDLEPKRIEEVFQQARSVRAFIPILVREDLSWEEVARIAVNAPDLPGVLLDSSLLRRYPHGATAVHVLGYVGPVAEQEVKVDADPILTLPELRIGKAGIERNYDHALRGKAGLSQIEVNATGREIHEISRREGEEGADLELSLDLDLQNFAMARLAEFDESAAVVVDVRTGAVLAMASVPTFDPHAFANGLSPRVWKELRDDPRHPLINRCVKGEYPPGSTFKMVTAMAGLEAGVITPSSEIFCPGHMSLGNARFHCWRPSGHGRLALVQAIAQSCDVFFYEVARRVGIDTLAAMARKLGLGGTLGVDITGERPGLIPTAKWKKDRFGVSWQKGETLVCGIGQGFVTATPLQLAIMTARLCNGGKAVTPWFVRDRSRPTDGSESGIPLLGVAKANLELVNRGMHEVIHGGRGTAKGAALPFEGIQFAGKTGTSQVRRITKSERASGAHKRKDRPRDDRDHALFVGYAPFDRPRYAVAVIVEHGESGSKTAGPVARDIMARTLELDPSGTGLQVRRTSVAAKA